MGFLKGIFLMVLTLIVLGEGSLFAEETKTESVCISCHQAMGDKLAVPVTLWEESIHKKMGNTCEGCHGGDPGDEGKAMDPASGFVGAPKPNQIAEFCGRCHVGVKENYMKSAHYAASLHGTGPNCVTCHHSHDVQKASLELIAEPLCSQCHSFKNAQKIRKAFVSAELGLQEKKETIRYVERRGMPVKRLEEKLFSLRNSLHQMTHTLDLPEIQVKTTGVLKELGEMEGEIEAFKKKIHTRWWVGSLFAGFLILLIVVLILLLKNYEEEDQ
ncbi:MAG: cytochrome c3 family protein [Deltaproteobacteria bacterium]|nr:cytochrome c3 family protein [Deltaproteobacteria bacterium]